VENKLNINNNQEVQLILKQEGNQTRTKNTRMQPS